MDRILIFHYHDTSGKTVRMSPSAYYVDAEYEKVAVRIYAEGAPSTEAEIDILDDGVSIFNERGSAVAHRTTGVISIVGSGTGATLAANQNSEDAAQDFTDDVIVEGSWVSCNLVKGGGGKNYTVQFELRQVSEGDEKD